MTNLSSPYDILFNEHIIPSDTPGIELYVRNKHRADQGEFSAEKTIVMVHGATFSSGSLYDVPFNGMSFMDFLASRGYDVFAVDVRGYGKSTRPKEMEQAAEESAPLVNTDVGVRDLGTAVDFVLAHRRLARTNVFAMSWGGTVAGAFAASNGGKVNKLALLAPQWLSDMPIPIDQGGPLAAYRLVDVHAALARWLSTAPENARTTLVPNGWFEQWAAFTLAEDPWSREKAPGRIRATNGPIEDIRNYWRANRAYYSPADLNVPVLLVHGEWDIDVPIDLAMAFFAELKNAPYRRWVEIGAATHLALMESNRMQAYEAIASFFAERFQPE